MNTAWAFNPTVANGLQNPMTGFNTAFGADPRMGNMLPATSTLGLGSVQDLGAASPSIWDRFSALIGDRDKMEGMGSLMGGLGALGGMYLGGRQLGLARDQLGLQREAFNANLNNSIQSYNTRLEDRIRGRSSNPNEADIQAYLARHSLSR